MRVVGPGSRELAERVDSLGELLFLLAQAQARLEGPGDTLHGDWSVNYSSLKDHEDQVINQYEAEIKEDLMAKLSLGEALERWGEHLLVAATGAIAKKG